jgi:hypothetical protein
MRILFCFFADSFCSVPEKWIECRAKQMNERLKTGRKEAKFSGDCDKEVMMSFEAGTGEHKAYRIMPEMTEDTAQLRARKHYVGVEAMSWYINKESSWFTKRMASGTLEIKLANGLEKYQAALGTFSLKGGAKFAPIFQKPVLPDRNYRGGPLTFLVHLTAIKTDNTVGSLLKSAANASLGIVAGMVDTAAVAGPAQLLMAAGGELVSGVRGILGSTAEGREPLFDDNGLELNIQASDVVGPAIYLLMHRGMPMDEEKLEVRSHGELLVPFYDGSLLEDGAWLLLRVRRTDEYNSVRSWYKEARALRGRIDDLANDVADHAVDKNTALNEFSPSDRGNKTIFDEYVRLRAVIRNDGVLTEREASSYVGQLRSRMMQARDAIEQGKESSLAEEMSAVTAAIVSGSSVPAPVSVAFEEEAKSIIDSRNISLVSALDETAVADLSGTKLIETMKYVPTSFDLSL